MKTPLLALITIPIVAAVSWASHSGPEKNAAQQMAGILSSILPKDMGNGGEMRSAMAEGDTLVILIATPSLHVVTASDISKMSRAAFCQRTGAKRFFENGGKLRFDIAMGGEAPVRGEVLESCPNS